MEGIDWFSYWNHRVGAWPTTHPLWRYACQRVREEIALTTPLYGSDEMVARGKINRHADEDLFDLELMQCGCGRPGCTGKWGSKPWVDDVDLV